MYCIKDELKARFPKMEILVLQACNVPRLHISNGNRPKPEPGHTTRYLYRVSSVIGKYLSSCSMIGKKHLFLSSSP